MTASFPLAVTAVRNPVQLYATIDDPLSVRLGQHQFRVPAWMDDWVLTEFSLSGVSAPTGTSVTITVRVNGVVKGTATLAPAATSGVAVALSVALNTGDLVRLAITQVDSGATATGIGALLIVEPPE